MFQHTAARRRLLMYATDKVRKGAFQHTAARRRLPEMAKNWLKSEKVSTHSRTKAAAFFYISVILTK